MSHKSLDFAASKYLITLAYLLLVGFVVQKCTHAHTHTPLLPYWRSFNSVYVISGGGAVDVSHK